MTQEEYQKFGEACRRFCVYGALFCIGFGFLAVAYTASKVIGI